jgi:twitching motility protein PilT
MRLLSTNIPKPADINMPVKLKEKGVLIRQGLVLITGPTGSGKSTTIASLLQERGTQRTEHILTLEDPIEFVYPTDLKALFTQREIGTDEPSYEMGLKAALRQAPHVILVGEIRDPESAEIALQAAETGHLVVSTFHTGSVVQTIQRFLQLIPPSRLGFATAILAETLEIVLVQRLISIQNNTKRLAIHEMMIKNTATANSIRSLGWNNLQTELDYGQDRGQLTFTRSVELARSKALITDTEASVILDLLKHKG